MADTSPSPRPPRVLSLIDTHMHLDQPEFDADRADVIDRARRAGIEAMVCVGATVASSEAAIRLAEQYPFIVAAVGIHPNSCAEAAADDWDRIVALAGHDRVVAIGETGLDRHWDFAPFDLQQVYLDRHLRLAQQADLPVIIHCREAEADVLPMLREAAARGPMRGILHAFSADAQTAAECLALGFHLSFAGNVTYTNKKFADLRAVAATVPDERLLVETDSPYLVPHPHRGKVKRNEPALVAHTAEALATLRGQSVEELSARTTANARRLFGITGNSR
jgi:TatD DNase family protein